MDKNRSFTIVQPIPQAPKSSPLLARFDRRHQQPPKEHDERGDAERDRDRILFSSAFRRLAGVTQVVAPTESHPIHNRLTHSLKVAQIGRGLAVTLKDKTSQDRLLNAGGLNEFVVEAAGLAHDLGHPPFGHTAERELNALLTPKGKTNPDAQAEPQREMGPESLQLRDGFEGNAQSFRIITRLSSRFYDLEGLDLTRATLCAVLKYPWLRGEGPDNTKKWGAYDSESKDLIFARMLADGQVQSLEAALMDWADDIAYAVHDLEDFYRAGLIPLDRLASSAYVREQFLEAEVKRQQDNAEMKGITIDDLREPFRRLICFAPFTGPFTGTQPERAMLRAFTSTLISEYIHCVSILPVGWGRNALDIPKWAKVEVETLKGLTFHYVIHSQSLSSLRHGQQEVIRSLYEIFGNAAMSKDDDDWDVLPMYFQEKLKTGKLDDPVPRMIADVIASMSEVQAIETHQRLTGQSFGSAFVRPSI